MKMDSVKPSQADCHLFKAPVNNLILIGFKRCGKTTFGRALAQEWGYGFIDTDERVAKDCGEAYRREGKEAFRAKEKEVIAALSGIEKTVIATGGGVVLDLENVCFLRRLGKVIYLVLPKEELRSRLLKSPLPAFFDAQDPEASFETMYQERDPLYRAAAEEVWEVTL